MTNLTKYVIALIAFIFLSFSCAADTTPEDKINSIEGVYKRRFENMLYDGSGEKFTSEDVVEIVRYSSDAVYFRAALKFANGHACSIWGIAKYDNGSYIYKSNEKPIVSEMQPCTLKISSDNEYLTLTDTLTEDSSGTCRQHCGARGSLSNYKIAISQKRKIRYMPIILKSVQYSESVSAYNEASTLK
ncbi:hypothetical protein GCM10011613_23160 [Cellvibrio zantedeschiae]|uniref:Lipoprotein n=1 Tax=Cellvibrio zantedeschiae TaxID=1237077 RepID=A0ABQ3B6V1_9GAMM|nr:hypothetical protein [Cellvibrio zantedeschiae]GGY77937.1 hypothetical protein GCM10011613_23160 [Cellvibrio zantedeschiae]